MQSLIYHFEAKYCPLSNKVFFMILSVGSAIAPASFLLNDGNVQKRLRGFCTTDFVNGAQKSSGPSIAIFNFSTNDRDVRA